MRSSDSLTKVLLAGSQPVVRHEVAVFLLEAGVEVREAGSLEEAWAALEADPEVDVLLADVESDEDDLAMAQRVHSRWPSIGLVLTSRPMRRLSPGAIPKNSCFVPRPLPTDLLLEEVKLLSRGLAREPLSSTG